ncbi:hypothetical protein, conserved [Plasmodium gonderi]|uniref:Periodic tryptophan protein 2 n=1 Tax=Plasmodium gonderi TaxID=77519 RepID=A0A1Y1J928_PLAGO|nr:hypothetical protein, conserved [Plasmodium gonderi]GAW79011.1 hypothetical protein, conserved [Plasmodium gonderi]
MMNYNLSNICGCVYTGGKIQFSEDGNSLFVPVSNRVNVYDLNDNKCNTLKSENKNDLRHIVIHPNMEIAITIDKFEYGCIINLLKDQIISRILFKSKTGIITSFNYNNIFTPQEEQDSVNCALFTHNGKYFLIGIGRRVIIWKSPNKNNNYKLVKYNDICYHSLNVTSIDVSEDDQFFISTSYDLTIRIHTIERRRKTRPTILTGNKTTIVAAYFSKGGHFIFSVNKSGLILLWSYETTGEAVAHQADRVDNVDHANHSDAADHANHANHLDAADHANHDNHSDAADHADHADRTGRVRPARRRKAYEKRWWQKKVYFCNQEKNEEVTSVCFNREQNMTVIAYSSGRFGIYKMPEMVSLYTISVSTNSIDDIAISNDGEWIALAESSNGTVIVWEWKSESYIMKQSTTSRNIKCVKFSPIISHLRIGSHIVENANTYHESENFTSKFVIVTGNEDGTIKLYDYISFMNFVTFTAHTDSVTDVCFLPQGNAFISCSLDGTIRAFDLLRYRNFKVYTADYMSDENGETNNRSALSSKFDDDDDDYSNNGALLNQDEEKKKKKKKKKILNGSEKYEKRINVQFLCVSVNLSGNIVAAGGRGNEYIVYIWNIQTGKCIDKLYGHNSPIIKVCFSTSVKNEGIIASCSWSNKVLLWDLYARRNKGSKFDEIVNSHDISYMCFDPRGNDILAICTLNCKIIFWDVQVQEIVGTIEGIRDIKRGQFIGEQFSAIPKMNKKRKKINNLKNGNDKDDEFVNPDELEDEGINTTVNQNSHFTSIDYVQNGNYIIGCANCSVSMYIYDTNLYVLIQIIDLTTNFSIDGIKREISKRYLTEQGTNIYEFDLSDEDGNVQMDKYRIQNRKKKNNMLPGSIDEHYIMNKFKKYKFILNSISISGDDRHVAVACSVGLYVFTKDYQFQYVVPTFLRGAIGEGKKTKNGYKGLIMPLLYEPQFLTEHVTLRNLKLAIKKNEYMKAFILCLALNNYEHMIEVYEKTPYNIIPLCVKMLSKPFVFLLINFIKVLLLNDTLKHIHLHLLYLNSIFTSHFSLFLNANFFVHSDNSTGGGAEGGPKGDDANKNILKRRTYSAHSSDEYRNALLLILKQVFTVYNGLQHLYSNNTHVLRYLSAG